MAFLLSIPVSLTLGKYGTHDKQEMFCREYLIDLNATQAAIRAGYSVKTANRIAARTCQNLTSKTESPNSKRSATKMWVLMQIMCFGAWLRSTRWTFGHSERRWQPEADQPLAEGWRTSLTGLDISTTIQNFDEETAETILKKVKWPDKVKNRIARQAHQGAGIQRAG
jgi:phage terminase small subunit